MWLMLLTCVGIHHDLTGHVDADQRAADVRKVTVHRPVHKPGHRRLGKIPVNTR